MSLKWKGSPKAVSFDIQKIKEKLHNTHLECFVIRDFSGRIGVSNEGEVCSEGQGLELLSLVPAITAEQLGDPSFREDYNLKYCYAAGAMANGISSTKMVIELAKSNILGSFGSAGLAPSKIEKAIHEIKSELNDQTFACNLIYNPVESVIEEKTVDLFLKNQITLIEASAYMKLTLPLVYFRAAGLSQNPDGTFNVKNRIIAKISRKEIAILFMSPAPVLFLDKLLESGKISKLQYELAQKVSMADDITVEADSGGHTDNRPLVVILPIIVLLRNQIQAKYNYTKKIRIGAAGGIATPESALAAFTMGAAYVVTGSINQSCMEAGTSDYIRELLSNIESTDIMMAPAADMFEMGVDLQVVKKNTLFGPRARKLFNYYQKYSTIEEIPDEDRINLEKQIFKMPMEAVWEKCVAFFEERDPAQISRANDDPHKKMALIFRWYLGLSSNWANNGEPDRRLDYQIWCGPAMGAFNEWVKGSFLENYKNRKVVDIAKRIIEGAAYRYRINIIKTQGILSIDELN